MGGRIACRTGPGAGETSKPQTKKHIARVYRVQLTSLAKLRQTTLVSTKWIQQPLAISHERLYRSDNVFVHRCLCKENRALVC